MQLPAEDTPNAIVPDRLAGGLSFVRPASADSRPRTILLIDDDSNSPLLVNIALRKLHPRPVLCYVPNAIQGSEYLLGCGAFADRLNHPFPHLVLLDIRMPLMDGFEFLAWARSRMEFRTLPVIVLTDSINPRDLSRAYQLGATSFLAKPSDMADLAGPLKAILQLHC